MLLSYCAAELFEFEIASILPIDFNIRALSQSLFLYFRLLLVILNQGGGCSLAVLLNLYENLASFKISQYHKYRAAVLCAIGRYA